MTLKSVEHPSDTIGELRERWDDRFTLASPALLKRYVEGELSIHLHIRCLLDGGSAEFCAVFERANHLGTTHGEIEAFTEPSPCLGASPSEKDCLRRAQPTTLINLCLSRTSNSWMCQSGSSRNLFPRLYG